MARRLAVLLGVLLLCGLETVAKPRVTVAMLGHADHGKSTLTAAITGVMSDRGEGRYVPYAKIASPSEIIVQGVKLAAARVEYETDAARYVHIDCRTDADVVRLLSAESVKLDVAILVVSAADGPMPQTREHLRLAQQHGVKALIVFINKIDLMDDPDLIGLIELELRELLTESEFKPDAVPFIRGSALMALSRTKPEIGEESILALLRALDSSVSE